MRGGLLPGGGAGQPGARQGARAAGARRGRSAGRCGAGDADSNQLSDPGSPTFRSPESLRGVRNGSCEILSKKQRQTLSPKGTFGSHFLSGGGLQSSQNEKAEMKTLQLFFFFFSSRGGCLEPLLSPPLWLCSPPLLHPSPGLGGGAGHPNTLGHCLGKGWGASTADYISHHAQHCGPHQTKKEVDFFTWIAGGPRGGRGRDRRLRWRLFTKFLVSCGVCVCASK